MRSQRFERRSVGGTALLPPGTPGNSAGFSFPIQTGLVAWFSTFYGDDTTHLTVAGSKITQFVNAQTTIAWPQATTSSQFAWELDSLAASLNGFPSGHPDAGDFYLGTEAAVLGIVKNNTAFTWFGVGTADTVTTLQAFFGWGNSAASTPSRAFGVDTTGVFKCFANDGAVKDVIGTIALANGQPYVFAAKGDGSNISMWVSAVVDRAATTQNIGVQSTVDRASIGSRPRSTNDLKTAGQWGEQLLYNTGLSDADIVTQSNALIQRWQLTYNRLVCEGDSLSRGFNSVSGTFLCDRMSLAVATQRVNAATNGDTTAGVLSTFAAQITTRRRWTAAKDVLHLWIGTNDITTTTDSAATIYGRITTIIDQAQALGFRVVVGTIIKRSDARLAGDGVTPANTVALALNALIIGNAAGAEAVYDGYTALNVTAGAEANTAPNTYYADDTHLTDFGYNLLAAGQQAAVNSVV